CMALLLRSWPASCLGPIRLSLLPVLSSSTSTGSLHDFRPAAYRSVVRVLPQGADLQAQPVEANEPFGVVLIVDLVSLKRDEIVAIQRAGGFATDHKAIALVELEPDGPCDIVLRLVNSSLQHGTLRGEPE